MLIKEAPGMYIYNLICVPADTHVPQTTKIDKKIHVWRFEDFGGWKQGMKDMNK